MHVANSFPSRITPWVDLSCELTKYLVAMIITGVIIQRPAVVTIINRKSCDLDLPDDALKVKCLFAKKLKLSAADVDIKLDRIGLIPW